MVGLTRDRVCERLIAQRVVPVLRLASAAQTREAVGCLHEAGFRVFEVTMTTPDAIGLIGDLSAALADSVVGAGTVLDLDAGKRCLEAGAQFLVSPCVVTGLAALAREAGRPALIGAFTPSEVFAAHREGADIVKVFPASSGGPSHLAALHAVFPQVRLCPTGGVGTANMRDYFKAGAALVGVGNNIVDAQALARGDRAAVVAHAAGFLNI